MKNNTLLCFDTLFVLDKAYCEGALAMRNSVSHTFNPYRADTDKHFQWECGHDNEAGCEHIRFGIDVITAPKTGTRFVDDPQVPRGAYGVNRDWYLAQLDKICGVRLSATTHQVIAEQGVEDTAFR